MEVRTIRSVVRPNLRYVSSDTKSGSSTDKATFNEPTSSFEHVTRESNIHKSPNWDQNVNFTLKECILYDINRHRNDYFNHKISQLENKFYSTAIQSAKRAMQSENKLLLIIGSILSIISSVVASNYINKHKQDSVKMVRKK
ncbi:10413_t:CDS:2 [Funneliformis mosseae]|uniref:10413_t:CDS:1 n=1 Tax=Funneliformis mosseae TaxID=27381 RepID=A0A9N9CDM1_FUNMO|nr:10413_t:CDS:2 [Funneliformis mosseae]